MKTTMIQIRKNTAHTLKNLKQYGKQSYDEIIRNLIEDAKAESLTEREKKDVEEALNDVRSGRVESIEEVAKELGVKLKA